MLHFLNDVAYNAESTKIDKYVLIASLKSEPMNTMINKIPGSRLLLSNLPGLALTKACRIARQALRFHKRSLSKEEGKDQESILSSTTPDPGHHMRK